MSSKYTITLMGANSEATSDTPTTTEVAALTNYTACSFDILYGHPEPEMIETETFESIDDYFRGLQGGKFRGKFTFKLKGRAMPTSESSWEVYFPEITPLKRRYLYIYSTNYPYVMQTGSKCYQVGLQSISFEHNDGSNKKNMILVLKTVNTLVTPTPPAP